MESVEFKELCALFCRVKEQAIKVFPQMASRKPIILAVPTEMPSVWCGSCSEVVVVVLLLSSCN